MGSARRRRSGLLLGLVCAAGAAAGTEGSETMAFRFAPPDGTECVQTISATREKVFGGIGRQVDAWESKTLLAYRRSGDGYEVTATPVSLEMRRDGQPVEDPVRALLHDIVIRYRIGSDGHIRSVEGFDGLTEKIRAAFPQQMAAALAPVLNEDALVAREKAEWDARVGDFAGREFAVGDAIHAELPYTLPNGKSIVYFTHTSFPGLEPCAAGSCARVSVRYDSDAAALAELAGEAVDRSAGSPTAKGPAPATAPARLSGTATRLIDPATMLIYEETQSSTLQMSMELPGRGTVPATVTEQRRYRFEYR